jgi:hypothetical protein
LELTNGVVGVDEVAEPDDAAGDGGIEGAEELLRDLGHFLTSDALVAHIDFLVDIVADDETGAAGGAGVDGAAVGLFDAAGADAGGIGEEEIEVVEIGGLEVGEVGEEAAVGRKLVEGEEGAFAGEFGIGGGVDDIAFAAEDLPDGIGDGEEDGFAEAAEAGDGDDAGGCLDFLEHALMGGAPAEGEDVGKIGEAEIGERGPAVAEGYFDAGGSGVRGVRGKGEDAGGFGGDGGEGFVVAGGEFRHLFICPLITRIYTNFYKNRGTEGQRGF